MSTDLMEHPAAATVQPSVSAAMIDDGAGQRPPIIAYMMSRFPKLTETFVLFEMQALERKGAQVEVFPLLRARNTATHPEGAGIAKKLVELVRAPASGAVMHPEAVSYVARAHFAPFVNFAIAQAQWHYLLRHPRAYFGALWTLIRANWGSANFLLGSLALFPKAVYFARQMERLDVRHVHAHFANHPAAAAYIIHRLSGIPYSFTAHGADLQVDQHMLREKVAAAKFVVSISHDNRRLIEKVCGADNARNVKIVRCGVDTSVFDARTPGADGRSQQLSIVCTGTLYEVKGHTYLIDACRLLRERGIPFVCRFIGDGPMRSQLESQVREAELTESILLLGRQTRQQIAEWLQAADVLVAPSVPTTEGRREGIPVVLMEAMACGLPVVASNISGIPELVDDRQTGLLVPPRDPAALADALAELSHDSLLRRRLGEAARAKVLSEFDLDKNAQQLLTMFVGDCIE